MEKTRKFGNFDWNAPRIRAALAKGEDAKELCQAFNRNVKTNYVNNPNMKVLNYNPKNKELIGSNIFVVSRLNELLEPSNIRTAIPWDDRYGDISRLGKDNFYTDFNALVLRTAGDSYERNDKITRDIAEKIENREGKLNLPVMIVRPLVRYLEQGSDCGLVFDLDNKTRIIEDERLDGKKYTTGMKFNDVDSLGLPLFDEEGTRTWYSRQDGLCRLVLDRGLDLGSEDGGLAYSNECGRVVVVSDGL